MIKRKNIGIVLELLIFFHNYSSFIKISAKSWIPSATKHQKPKFSKQRSFLFKN